MVLPSIYYFLIYSAISFLNPFLALYYKSQGLTGGQIGLLVALIPLLKGRSTTALAGKLARK